jgi:hypothetical protein
MTEYVGYYESHIGHYMPIIVVIDEENDTKEFQEMKKEDILRIPDQHNSPGNWLYKKGQSIRESWQKRFMLLRLENSFLLVLTTIFLNRALEVHIYFIFTIIKVIALLV